MSAFLISQILIGFAFLSDLASFQFKKRETTLLFFFISATLIATHYFLLGAIAGGLIIGVSALRFLTGVFTTSKYPKYFFLVLVLGIGIYTFESLVDVLPVITGVFGTLATFQKNEKHLRYFMMVASIAIIAYNVLVFTPAGIALETFFLGSNLLSYWRFYMRKQEEKGEA